MKYITLEGCLQDLRKQREGTRIKFQPIPTESTVAGEYVIINDQKPVDYQAPSQFNLQPEGEEVEWQGI